MILKEIIENLNNLSPTKLAEKWDNSGLQVGDISKKINKILLVLDVTKEAIQKCEREDFDLIISHHPLIFSAIKTIDYKYSIGNKLEHLIKANINVFSMHTNLDCALEGVNHCLSKVLNLPKIDILHKNYEIDNVSYGYGFISEIKSPILLSDFAKETAKKLNAKALKYCGKADKKISKIAFCGGSGGSFIDDAIKANVDVYITGDIGHHDAQKAIEQNLAIIDAGHYDTEKHVLHKLYSYLKDRIDNQITIEIFDYNPFEFTNI